MANNDEIEDELDVIPQDQQENESDLVDETIAFKDAVVMNADWTVETLNGQVGKGNIDLEPSFQRRAVWGNVRQSRLIESIIAGMPIPNIVLAENKKHRGKFIVIDGKQRLLGIRNFMTDSFVLSGLDIRKDLNGKKYSGLPAEDKEYFDNNTIRSTVIKNWSDEKFLFAIFYRLNSGSLQLSPQELRRALIGGRLLDAIEQYVVTSESFHAIFGNKLDPRMRDSELVLRFIAFDKNYQNYQGNLRKFFDETAEQYEKNWDADEADLKERFARLDLALNATKQIFKENALKKWANGKFERRINRAVFDCMTRYFAEQQVADAAIANADAVVKAFQSLCDSSEPFRNAIERSTKDVKTTKTRLDEWGNMLAGSLGATFDEASTAIVIE
ncbi:MAG: DUF262 domain-containing protein [Gallionella sp.]|nr:DUF262 domain-containing protein [Gallionella sp.]